MMRLAAPPAFGKTSITPSTELPLKNAAWTPAVDRLLHVAVHRRATNTRRARPTETPFREQPAGIGVRVEVRDVRHVVAVLLHPKRQRKLPQQELAGALRQRRVEDLPVLAVRPVEADPHTWARVPVVRRRAVVVQRPQVGPAVVRRPRRVRALKQKIALADRRAR